LRKMLLASAFALVPFVAFAGNPSGLTAAGDINVAKTSSTSNAGVFSSQGTMAGARVDGNGAVVVGAVSGNYTTIQTNGSAKAGPQGSSTNASATQFNVGGTIAGGYSTEGKGRGNEATGSASGGQSSGTTGGSTASASNTNVGGFVTIQQNHHH
jgi:hypothetical protein